MSIQLCPNSNGTSAVEFALTAPLFMMLVFGVIEGGLLLWSQINLQRAVAIAARCASVDTLTCADAESIQNYAAQQAYGISLPASTFTIDSPACGNRVTAVYTYRFLTTYFGMPTQSLTAQSCFPRKQ
ncbi:MAG TPA: TadE family protein [Pseudolabrys sp.]|nr:TadE family protein [Pseudolabrys sp.]